MPDNCNRLPKTNWDQEVLDFACDHIKYNDIWSDEMMPVGGVHVKPKPRDIRFDVIEINQLFSMVDYKDGLKGVININIFDDKIYRIKALSEVVELIMEDAFVREFVFDLDYKKIMKWGKYTTLMNMRYYYRMPMVKFCDRYQLNAEEFKTEFDYYDDEDND